MDSTVAVRIDKELYEGLKKVAKQNGRTLKGQLDLVLREALGDNSKPDDSMFCKHGVPPQMCKYAECRLSV